MEQQKLDELFPEMSLRIKEKDKFIIREVGKSKKLLNAASGAPDYKFLKKKVFEIEGKYGPASALNFIYRLELATGKRKPSLAIYDHAFHFIGGAQKYGLVMVKALEKDFDITIISNRKVSHEDFFNWYGIDSTGFRIKIIPLPYFDNAGTFHIEPHRVDKKTDNPFHLISRESGMYDIFINNSMLEMVYPLSPVSIMVCHFPERRPVSYFYSDIYTYTVFNSNYTKEWIEKRWKYTPHKHIYPPVNMSQKTEFNKKDKIILSVARFEEGGTKKQLELVRSFIKMVKKNSVETEGWKLVLAGGSGDNNPYIEKLSELILSVENIPIELRVNISDKEIRKLYANASIFWHLCGLGQNDPAKVEHFGMTIAEAMQNGIVPVVFDGGGQKEIVDQGVNGFRVKSSSALIKISLKIISDPVLRKKMSKNAIEKSVNFDIKNFEKNVSDFFSKITSELL